MAVVVDQSIPWAKEKLDLENPSRWNVLFPLIRPTVAPYEAGDGQDILVDNLVASTDEVRVVAVGRAGNFSSKFLSGRHVAAFVTERTPAEKSELKKTATEALASNGVGISHGLVIVRNGTERKLEDLEDGVSLVETEGELEFNHVLSLLENVKSDVGSSMSKTTELLKHFLKSGTSTKSSFRSEKVDGNVSVIHETGDEAFQSAKQALEKDLTHALRSRTAKEESVVYSVHYADVNGLAQLENYILAHEISNFLDEQNLSFHLTSSALVSDTSSARGWAISVCPVPSDMLSPLPKPSNSLSQASAVAAAAPSEAAQKTGSLEFSDSDVRKRLERGCNAVINAERTITEYDTIVGDGDCGMTLRDGAQKAMEFVASRDLAQLPQVITELVDDLEVTMGGTSGALYCIFLSALAQGLRTSNSVPDALEFALEHLLRYTKARKGDRTCIDCLIPYVETLKQGGTVSQAVEEAGKGVEATKTLDAKLGRSTYLDEKATRGVPDPGAYGLMQLLEGLSGA